MTVIIRLSLALVALVTFVGCSVLPVFMVGVSEPAEVPLPERYPDVIGVQLVSSGDRVYDVVVSISSPYDSPERYADGWRVLDPAGNVLGTHTLLHDHADEQPFTRTQPGLEIPEGVTTITVEGRDLVNGYGGGTLSIDIPEPNGSTGATSVHDGS